MRYTSIAYRTIARTRFYLIRIRCYTDVAQAFVEIPRATFAFRPASCPYGPSGIMIIIVLRAADTDRTQPHSFVIETRVIS